MLSDYSVVWILVGLVGTLFIAVGILAYALLRRKASASPRVIEETAPRPTTDGEPATIEHPGVPAAWTAGETVALDGLYLQNIRSFSDFKLRFAPPAGGPGTGQWTVILGDNGVGKSTILRAIVLALADPDVATALLQTQKSPAPFIRRGAAEGITHLTLSGMDLNYALAIGQRDGAERLRWPGKQARRPPLFAYGPLRGSAIGGSARQVSFSEVGPIATLFDESAQLIHAETWLVQRQLAALQSKGGPAEAFFDAALKTIRELLPGVEKIEVTAESVEMTGPEIGDKIPIAGMSDGYVGTIGWVLDLIARWSDRQQKLTGTPPDGSLARDMHGLVVVDEIGLHLHPRWQTTVLKDLRDRFPNLSFLVSSHHPLLLLGAHDGEIQILRRNPESRQVMIEQANIPPGTTSDQILTGRWFNLPSTLDDDTKKLLEEHRQLLRTGKDDTDARVAELQKTLRGRLGTFADTSVDRMALQVAAQVIKEKEADFVEVSPERKEEIRREMMQELESRMSKQKT